MIFALSLAAAAIAAGAVTMAARQARWAQRPTEGGHEEDCYEVIGGPLDGLRIPRQCPLADDEVLSLTVTDSGDVIVATRACHAETAQALRVIAHRMETGGDGQ